MGRCCFGKDTSFGDGRAGDNLRAPPNTSWARLAPIHWVFGGWSSPAFWRTQGNVSFGEAHLFARESDTLEQERNVGQ